jgi:hypothetical protein
MHAACQDEAGAAEGRSTAEKPARVLGPVGSFMEGMTIPDAKSRGE